jgi:hypothetical protein
MAKRCQEKMPIRDGAVRFFRNDRDAGPILLNASAESAGSGSRFDAE